MTGHSRLSRSPLNELDPAVLMEVLTRWEHPCEAMFEYLAEHHPSQLLALLRSPRLSPADLTFAAEIAGRIPSSAAVREALLPLLDHPKAVVREGAVYGLGKHLDDPVRQRLARLAEDDQSAAVRCAAAETILSA